MAQESTFVHLAAGGYVDSAVTIFLLSLFYSVFCFCQKDRAVKEVITVATRLLLLQLTYMLFIFRTGGTAGAVLTCPLEVIKTRLQSSIASKQYKKPSSTGSSNFDRSGGIINKGPHTRYIRGGLTDNVITLAKTSPNQLKVAHLCTQGSAASQHVMPTTLWRCFRLYL